MRPESANLSNQRVVSDQNDGIVVIMFLVLTSYAASSLRELLYSPTKFNSSACPCGYGVTVCTRKPKEILAVLIAVPVESAEPRIMSFKVQCHLRVDG